MNVLIWLASILALAVIGFIVYRFWQYKLEADAEDRYRDEQDALDDICEHRAAPEHDKSGILRCPTCGKDLEQ